MSQVQKLSLILFISMVFFSCFDGDSKQEMLTSAKWKVIDKLQYNSYQEIETSTIEACLRDNVYSFNIDGRFEIEKNNNLCNPNDTDDFGSWKFSENEKQLTLQYDSGFKITYTIEELTNNRMELYWEDQIELGFVWKYITVFSL